MTLIIKMNLKPRYDNTNWLNDRVYIPCISSTKTQITVLWKTIKMQDIEFESTTYLQEVWQEGMGNHSQIACSLGGNILFCQAWEKAILIAALFASVMMDYAMTMLLGSFSFPLSHLLFGKRKSLQLIVAVFLRGAVDSLNLAHWQII